MKSNLKKKINCQIFNLNLITFFTEKINIDNIN